MNPCKARSIPTNLANHLTFEPPPKAFRPVSASAKDLDRCGIIHRPDPRKAPEAARLWRWAMSILLAQVALACLMSSTLRAQNLIQNPGFETPATGVPPGRAVSVHNACAGAGNSAAADWVVFVNACGTNISTELVPSTLPGGGNYMMHVVTNGADNGIAYCCFVSTPKTQSSVWVYVNQGCAGMATGPGGGTSQWGDEIVCETGSWIQMKAPSEGSAAIEFIVYSEADCQNCSSPSTYDFYVDNVDVVAAPTANAQVAGAFRTQNGHYVTAVNGGGLGGPDSGPGEVALHTDATKAGPWEMFTIVWVNRAQCKFALKTSNNNFVTAVNGGGIGGPNSGQSPVHTDATVVGPWEHFTITPQADNVHATVRTSDGRNFLTAVNGGGLGGPNDVPIHTDANSIGPWEEFTLIPPDCGAQ